MAQFRLTRKFASDLKISLRESPKPQMNPLDDWVCDVFRVNRKKVALITHAESLVSFLFPYKDVGGAKNVLDFLPIALKAYLIRENLEKWEGSIERVFSYPHVFTKTENKRVLGHMNDFKKAVLYSSDYPDEDPNWDETSNYLKTILVKSNDTYLYPNEILNKVLKMKDQLL